MRAAAFVLAASALSASAAPPVVDSSSISGLGARNIGSAQMSGRIAAVAGRVEDDGKVTLFVGAASGGVWKSLDGGTTFKPVFDKQPVQSIGAIALDPSDPKVVWVGTGESWTRNSVSAGGGIWRSGDGGESWTHMGLPESERVNRILVNPRKSDVVYACVPGKLWSDSPDRGLYKTSDGGKSWSLVLRGGNLSTGCSGLAMDPRNPDRLSRASGISGGRAGRSVPGATDPAGRPARASFSRRTAARRGGSSKRSRHPACPRVRGAGSTSRSRRRSPTASTP
jgi:hypothetical protein